MISPTPPILHRPPQQLQRPLPSKVTIYKKVTNAQIFSTQALPELELELEELPPLLNQAAELRANNI